MIEGALRADGAQYAWGSGRFTHRVLSRLGDSQPSNRAWPIRAALSVAACIVIAATAAVFLTRPATQPAGPSTVTIVAFVPPDADLETAWTRLIERPLVAEAESLTNDTESGIRFLVACLNVSPAYNTPDAPLR